MRRHEVAGLPRLEDEVGAEGAWTQDDERRERERLLPTSSTSSTTTNGLLNLGRKKTASPSSSFDSPDSQSSSSSFMAWGAEVRVEDVRAWWWPIKLPLISGGSNAAVVNDDEREIYGEVEVDGDGDHAGRRKWLLRGIKARAQPGRLLAILGPSGSGKTTLLNVMAGRVEHGSSMGLLTRLGVEGGVLYNDIALAPQEVVGYVLQHDHLLPHLTVRETLRYAGFLRLPPSLARQRKLQIVEEVIMELGLKDCANRRVGGDGAHGISGGERRRVSIGIQMLTDPGVLFLDEPTSGLDSYTANKLVSTLADLAHQGRTIVCTIHQPRSDIFQLFDDVMLLSKGHQVYYGPAQSMLDYFQRLGYVCPTHTNPADYALDLIAIDLRSPEVERASYKRLAKLTAQYRDAQQQQQQRDMLDPSTAQAAQQQQQHSKEARDHIFNQMKQQHVNVIVQMLVLVARAFKNIVRDKMVIMVRLIEALLMGVCVGGIFYQMDTDNVASLRSRSAALYAIVSLQPYLIMLATIVQYESELKVFSREYFDNMVGVVPYFMSMLLTSLPFSAVLPSVFCAIVYWMAGLRPEWEAFLWFLLIMTVMQYVGEALGYACIALIRSFGPASLAGNSFATFWTVTAGFLLNPISFPIYLRYIGYTSPFQYAYAALAVVEYKDNEYDCPYPPENPLCLNFDGNYILSQQNLIFDTLRPNLLIVGAMAIGFRIIALLILVLFKQKP